MNSLQEPRMNAMLSTVAMLLLLLGTSVRAETQYWDADGFLANNDCATGAGLGGAGTWDAYSPLWTTNECDNIDPPVPWTDYNDAVFSGVSGNVTLAEPRAVGNLTFTSGGYKILDSTLTLGLTNTPCITNTGLTTLVSTVAGTNGYSKYGSGTLFLNNAANSIRGPIAAYEGILRFKDYTCPGANHVGQTLTLDNATLRNDDGAVGGTFLSKNVILHVGTNNATINLYANGGLLLYSTNILGVVTGQGTLTKAGPGELRNYNAHNTFGKLVIAGGFFTAGQSTYAGYADTFGAIPEEVTDDAITIINGAELRLVGGANVTLDAKQGITIGEGGGQIAVYSGRTLHIMGSIKAGANWLETGDGDVGTVSLRGANELAWVTNTSGVLLVRHSAALGDNTFGTVINAGSALEVSSTVNVPEPLILAGTGRSNGGALRNNSNHNIWSGPITLNSDPVRINSDQASLTLGGGVFGEANPSLLIGGAGNVTISTNQLYLGAGTLTKDGAGTLTLGTSNHLGSVTVTAGRLVVNAPDATGSGPVTISSGAILSGNGAVNGFVALDAGASIGGGDNTQAGILTLANGADLSLGLTNLWKLTGEGATPGVDFDTLALSGGNLILGGSSVLSLKFSGAASVPDLTNAFWHSARQWTIVALSGSAANPDASNFSAIDGTNGITIGTFATSVDTAGNVVLSYTPNIVIPPAPVIDPNIIGAGTPNAQLSWSSADGATYRVLYRDDLGATTWSVLTNVTATGNMITIEDSTTPVPASRFYRVVSP